MKQYFCYLLMMLCLLAACATKSLRLPELTAGAADLREAEMKKACASVFSQGRWQFVHSIDFVMVDGSGGTVVGVTTVVGKEIECTLVTVDGLTLFEAVYKEGAGLEVRRAVSPFDKRKFAEGLMRDVQAIFLPPPGSDVKYGQSANKAFVCRYTGANGRVTDVLPDVNGCWRINTYNAGLIVDRTIIGRSCRKKGASLIPEYLELRGFGQTGYTLKMTLISAENLRT